MKEYKFYKRGPVADVHAVNLLYEGIDTPFDLYDKLMDVWCIETCAPRLRAGWSDENKTLGQCSVTAFLAQDIFGGEVYAMPTDNGGLHCYNKVGDAVFDLTSEQFLDKAGELVYDCVMIQDRESADHFTKEEKRARYEYLREHLPLSSK